jgi:hypothetical protein
MTQQRCNTPGGIDQNKRDDHTKTARIENSTKNPKIENGDLPLKILLPN